MSYLVGFVLRLCGEQVSAGCGSLSGSYMTAAGHLELLKERNNASKASSLHMIKEQEFEQKMNWPKPRSST
jgi:hypothetical protein